MLKNCMALKPFESLLVITDKKELGIGRLFLEEAQKITKNVLLIKIPVASVHGEEPSDEVAREMLKYDVILMPTTKSLSHTTARKFATEHGARIASMPGVNLDMIKRSFRADYKKITERTSKIENAIRNAQIVKITTKKGTDITVKPNIKLECRDQGLYCNKGDWGNLPAGEMCFLPLENYTNGVFVVDAAMAGLKKELVKSPIKITVKDGYAITIEGKKEAVELKKLLKGFNDLRVYNIAEVGIGTNDKARVTGNVLEDEKVLGTVHIALGNNISYKGTVDAPCHLDGVFKKPTIFTDSKMIMKDGMLKI